MIGPQGVCVTPLAADELKILLAGCARHNILDEVRAVEARGALDEEVVRGRRLLKTGCHIPVKAVGAEDALLLGDDFVEARITHREAKAVDVVCDAF